MSASGPSGPLVLGRNPKFGVCMHLGMAKCHIPSLGHLDPDLASRMGNESGAYLLYSLR